MLGEFPGAEFAVYNFSFPGDWNELVKEEINGVEDAADDLLHLDFWDGMTSVEGYSAIRFYDSIFYKTPHLGTWDTALTYDTNQISPPSRAASRTGSTPPSESICRRSAGSTTARTRPASSTTPGRPEYVSEQLEAFRKWGTGGEFANFVYGGLDPAQYEDYVGAMQDASSPGTVDETDPTVEIAAAGPAPGNHRNRHRQPRDQGGALAGRPGRFRRRGDALGGARRRRGRRVRMGDALVGAAAELSPGASELTVTAEDIKGRTSAPVVEPLR